MSYILEERPKNVYLKIAQNDGLNISDLARLTEIYRPQLYEITSELIRLGLIRKIRRGGRQVFVKSGKEKLLGELRKNIGSLKAESRELVRRAFSDSGIVWIDNKADIIAMYQDLVDSLKPQDPYYSVVSNNFSYEKLNEYFPKNFRVIRQAKNLWSYVITDNPLKKTPRFNLDIKEVNWKMEKNCLWLVYGKKFAFVDFSSETGYIIADERLAAFQQEIIKQVFALLPEFKYANPKN